MSNSPGSSSWTTTLDALRARGWMVAVHNDYRLNGTRFTFWLMSKGMFCAMGEGLTDADAIEELRFAVDRVEQEIRNAVAK